MNWMLALVGALGVLLIWTGLTHPFVARLGGALDGHAGLASANATLMGDVTLTWDDEQTSRDALIEAMAKAGFRELPADL